MAKYSKTIRLSIGQYRTMEIGVTDMDSFAACDKALIKELKKHPEVYDMNVDEIKRSVTDG